ncbi:MAG TPA: TIGR02300 family protein [Dongiaceae bacterium]
MTKPEWGTKRTCQSCGAHFYDLRKDPIQCPKCGAVYDPEAILKSRRRAPEKIVPAKVVKAPELPDVEAEAEAEEGAEEADDVIEDTSELGEDDADIPESIESDTDETER